MALCGAAMGLRRGAEARRGRRVSRWWALGGVWLAMRAAAGEIPTQRHSHGLVAVGARGAFLFGGACA
jgi:hypothetical protein